jgi:DNA-binding CsgD family transcriptional regulator
LRRQETMARGLGVAAGALSDLMEGYFRDWGLTSAEQDVAAFTIKGYSIAEIAELRGSAEATVKTHLNAIYRKAGVPGRGQLVSLLIEDLMRAPLMPSEASAETHVPKTSVGPAPKNAYSSAR